MVYGCATENRLEGHLSWGGVELCHSRSGTSGAISRNRPTAAGFKFQTRTDAVAGAGRSELVVDPASAIVDLSRNAFTQLQAG